MEMDKVKLFIMLVLMPPLMCLCICEEYKSCGLERHCVPYGLCNEGLMVDGHFYPDHSRKLEDEEHCHYMEKCCSHNETVSSR